MSKNGWILGRLRTEVLSDAYIERERIRASVRIFGKTIPIEFEFYQKSENVITQAIPYETASTASKLSRFMELCDWRERSYPGENDPVRVGRLIRLIDDVSYLPEGDYLEMGTQYGGTARLIYKCMRKDRNLYCFDTFQGFMQPDLDIETELFPEQTFTTETIKPVLPIVEKEMERVKSIITDDIDDDRVMLIGGRVPESLLPYGDKKWCFAHLDMDLYEPTRVALEWLWPRMVPGGIIFLHDYDTLGGIKKAVDEFVRPLGQMAIPMGDRFGSVVVFRPFTN